MKKINAFYRMLLVFSLVALLAKLVGLLEFWHEVPLWIMVEVFFFAGVSHFTKLKHEFAKMIPPAIPGKMFWVYFTGVLEIVGAIDLIDTRTRYYAGWALIIFLILVFPANFYAAKMNIKFRGKEPLSVAQRGAVQILFIVALYIGAIHFHQ
jgi:uncharacterized membrane protein